MSLAKDVKGDIYSINENAQSKPSHEHIRQQFIELIRFTDLKWQDFFFCIHFENLIEMEIIFSPFYAVCSGISRKYTKLH